MRLFLTSFQKSGTHQSYPMFLPDCPSIVDRSYIIHKGMDDWGFPSDVYPRAEMSETIEELKTFYKHGKTHRRAFGHVAYLPEYAAAVQAIPTKVIFNVRDPRDVVIAEIAHIKIFEKKGKIAHAWLNFKRVSDGKRINELDDPIMEMIKVDAARWRNWIGWLDHPWTIRLQYEELRLRPLQTATILAEELSRCRLPKSPEEMVKATEVGRLPESKTPSFRKGKVGEWKTHFQPRHKELAAELMGDIIEKLGYEV